MAQMASNIFRRLLGVSEVHRRQIRSISSSSQRLIQTSSLRMLRDSTDINISEENAPAPRPPLPLMVSRTLAYPAPFKAPRQSWVSNLDTIEEEKLGLVDLHPDVFAYTPRIDVIHENIRWQRLYRHVDYANTKVRTEVRGGGRKPRPQKGLGRSRHGSIRSPIWKGGGVVHGPRSPNSYFYMLGFDARLNGLRATLSVKMAQDDLHIVDSLDQLPTDDPKFLEELVEQRGWGPAVLFVDDNDVMPNNITAATDSVGHFNLMPVYGLNVYGMLKHQTLVLTLAALERIEERLLFHLHRNDAREAGKKYRLGSR